MFTALLDTCVLWPSLQRDFLLSLAVEGVYRPVWSSAVLEELQFHEARKLAGAGIEPVEADRRAARLIAVMRTAFDDAEVTGWEPLEGSYGLIDPDDEHIVAAAMVAGAGALVTSHVKHFPGDKVPATVTVMTPAQFVQETTVAVVPGRAIAAVQAIAGRSGSSGRPSRSVEDIFNHLEDAYQMTAAVNIMRNERDSS